LRPPPPHFLALRKSSHPSATTSTEFRKEIHSEGHKVPNWKSQHPEQPRSGERIQPTAQAVGQTSDK
jgi:hypothetical protein